MKRIQHVVNTISHLLSFDLLKITHLSDVLRHYYLSAGNLVSISVKKDKIESQMTNFHLKIVLSGGHWHLYDSNNSMETPEFFSCFHE